MLKLALAVTALTAAGTTAYVLHGHAPPATPPTPVAVASPRLHYGPGPARTAAVGATAPRHTTLARRAAVDDLGWLPANADFVLGADMTRIQTSTLWQMFVAPALEHASGIDSFVSACGFDPFASLTRVTIGVTGLGSDSDPAGTFVLHGFDKTKAMACVTSYVVPAAGGANVTVDGDVVLVSNSGGTSNVVGLTFLDDSTALIVVGPAASSKASVEQVAAGSGALASSPAFTDLFADIDSDDPLWLMVAPGSPIFTAVNDSLASSTPIRVSAAYGSLDVSSSLSVQAGLRLASPEQVAQLIDTVHTKIAQLGAGSGGLEQYFDQLDVTADGSDLILSASANAGQLMTLASAATVQGNVTAAGSDTPGTYSLGVGVDLP